MVPMGRSATIRRSENRKILLLLIIYHLPLKIATIILTALVHRRRGKNCPSGIWMKKRAIMKKGLTALAQVRIAPTVTVMHTVPFITVFRK